jgi:hypothetical protein
MEGVGAETVIYHTPSSQRGDAVGVTLPTVQQRGEIGLPEWDLPESSHPAPAPIRGSGPSPFGPPALGDGR